MQDTRSETAYHSTKLCFLILTCVSEDEYANALMHDPGLTFRVPLHRLPMRHRKVLADKTPPFRPLVCGLLGTTAFIHATWTIFFVIEIHLEYSGILIIYFFMCFYILLLLLYIFL